MFYQDLGYNKLLNKNVLKPPLNSAVVDSEIEPGAIDLDKTNINRLFKTGRIGYLEIDNKTQNAPFIRVYTKENGLKDTKVILGNLKDKTGTEEYGVWIKSGAAYIGGYRLYEAVVDASGDGDYTTIHDAVNDGKKRIFIRSGTYTFTSDLNLLSDTILLGESRESVILKLNSDSLAYQIKVDNNNITIQNLTIKIDHVLTYYGIRGNGNNIIIQYINIEEGDGGIGPESPITLSGDNILIHHCNILCNNSIYVYDGENFRFFENYVYDNGTTTNPELTCENNNSIIYNNVFKKIGNGNGGGISISGTNVKVINNFLYAPNLNYGKGINLANTAKYCSIRDNYCDGWHNAIFCNGDHSNVISGNISYNCKDIAFYIHPGADNSGYTIGFLNISDNIAYNSLSFGFDINGTHISFINNIAYSCDKGFVSDGLELATFIGNRAINCTGHGFNLYNPTFPHIRYCIISNNHATNSGTGFRIYDVECIITGNIATDNTTGSSLNNDPGSKIDNNIGF